MPYSGIKDPAVIRKLDRCVKDVMGGKKHHTKSEAIAICRASMKKELERRTSAFASVLGVLGIQVGEKQSTGSDSIAFSKMEDDSYRYVVMMSNKWRDLTRTPAAPRGEVFTDASHKEFIAWLDEHPDQAPEWWCWHTPGSARKSRVDFWDYVDGSVVLSGVATAEEAAPFQDSTEPIGVSHSYYVLARDPGDRSQITKYRTFEWSDLPMEAAANPGAGLSFIEGSPISDLSKEAAMPFSTKKRAYLVEKLGESKVAELEKVPGDLKSLLEGLGVDSKALEAIEEPEPPVSSKEGESQTPPEVPPDYVTVADFQAAIKALGESLKLGELNAVIVDLKSQLAAQSKELTDLKAALEISKKSADDRVRDALAPAVTPWKWGEPPSQSKDTAAEPDDPAIPQVPPTLEWAKTAFKSLAQR